MKNHTINKSDFTPSSLFSVSNAYHMMKLSYAVYAGTTDDIGAEEDWSITEKMTLQRNIIGFYDKGLIVGKFIKTFEEFNIQSIDEGPDDINKEKVWAIIEKVMQKTTRGGKPYLIITATGLTEKPYSFRIWNTSMSDTDIWNEGSVVVFSLYYDKEWGYNLSKYSEPLKVTK